MSGVLDTLPVFADGTLVATVGRAEVPGLYARAGNPPVLVALAGVILISTGLGTRGRPQAGVETDAQRTQ